MKALRNPWSAALLCLGLGLWLALVLPPYSGPDESGHVAYIAALNQGHWPLLSQQQGGADIRTGTTWQVQHPPLYYLLVTPLYHLLGSGAANGLFVARFVSLLSLVVVVLWSGALVRELSPAPESSPQAWLPWVLATHPTLLYICAMANNEGMSAALSVGALWAAARFQRSLPVANPESGQTPRWPSKALWLVVLLSGLALLTKLTAIAGVVGAAYLAGRQQPSRIRLRIAAFILVGSVLFWLPWGLWATHLYGTPVPNSFDRPAFQDGIWGVLFVPLDAVRVAYMMSAQFLSGLVWPYWIFQGSCINSYLTKECGATCSDCRWLLMAPVVFGGGLCYLAYRHPSLRFAFWSIVAVFSLILWHEFSRDGQTLFFASRYTPTSIILATLLAGAELQTRPRSWRWIAGALWGVWVLYALVRIVLFFRPLASH